MMIKASGRSALILATGLFVCFAGPSQAAASADSAAATSKSANLKSESLKSASLKSASLKSAKSERHSRHLKRFAHRKYGKVALKSVKKPDVADDDADNSSALPPSVANANAQLASADVPGGSAKAMTARANTIVQAAPDNPPNAQAAADSQVVAPDQLNDVDRALHESSPSAKMVMASADAPAARATASSDDNSTWDQTSLIGKIFIAFGALLTMASAARMFMA
jgi:hypothetical protein